MALGSNARYTDGSYLKQKPTWDDEYAPWKAAMIAELMERNQLKPESVMEVGCGAGGILTFLQTQFLEVSQWSGYDISPDAIALAQKKANPKLNFFTADLLEQDSNIQSDLLLCIDVIEHIDDFYHFLQRLKTRGRQFIFHIPLDLSCRTLLKPHVLKYQRDLVGHIHYFSKEMVEWMLKDCGYEIIDWNYTKPIIDTEQASGVKHNLKKFLRNTSFRLHKDWSAKLWGGYSMLILAK